MFDFTTTEETFLKNLGESSQGRDLKRLFHRMRSEIDRTSNIPKSSDYGAEVEGRKLVSELLSSVIEKMTKSEKSYKINNGNDEFD